VDTTLVNDRIITVDEFLRRIDANADDAPPGGWLLGYSLDRDA
jgi:hypothetical protein